MEDLNSLLNNLIQQSGGAQASSGFSADPVMGQMKNQLKQQMSGLATTQTGIDVLRQIVSNTSVDVVERTAAAEVLNPGTIIELDASGGFRVNSPASNVSYDPAIPHSTPAGMQESQKLEIQNNTAKRAATVPELLEGISLRMNEIQTQTDPDLVAQGMANVTQSIADFRAARIEELQMKSKQMFGIDALENQIEVDKRLDMQAAQEMYGVSYTGMSSESKDTYTQLQMAQGKANEWLQTQLSTDPTLAAVDMRAKYLQSYANERFGELAKIQGLAGTVDLVSPQQIDGTLMAIGIDPLAATPEQRREISLNIQSNNSYFVQASELGQQPNQLPLYLSAGGNQATMARNVLVAKTKDPEFADQLIGAYNNFEAFSGLTPQQMEERGFTVKQGIDAENIMMNSKEGRAQAEAMAKMAKWKFITDAYNQQAVAQVYLMEGFDPPQNQLLGDMPSIMEGLQSARAAYPTMAPVTLAEVVKRIEWPENKEETARKQEALVDYIYSQAQKKGNSVIGMPSEFGNRALVNSFVEANRIAGKSENKFANWQGLGYFGGAMTQFGGPVGMAIGIPSMVVASKAKAKKEAEQKGNE